MKKKFAYFVMGLSLVLSVAAVPVAAHAESIGGFGKTMAEDKVTSTDSSTTKSTDDSTATSTDDSAGRATRLENEKKNLKEALTTAAKARIAERCVAAQAIVKTKTTNNGTATAARTNAYSEIVTDLQALVTAAQAKNADVSALQAEITSLQTKITAFTTANTTYQQALTDLGVLDCKTDPVAFKAALESARTDQLAVFTSAKDIRTYITDTIKPTLQTLKTQLSTAQ